MDAFRIYDTSMPREPQWGEDFFGIEPFYIPTGGTSTSVEIKMCDSSASFYIQMESCVREAYC